MSERDMIGVEPRKAGLRQIVEALHVLIAQSEAEKIRIHAAPFCVEMRGGALSGLPRTRLFLI